jgi:hypothetical protein
MLRDRNSVALLAAHWDCSTTTIYRLIQSGQLACLGGAGKLRISRQEVERYEGRNTRARLDSPATPASPEWTLGLRTRDPYMLGRLIAGEELKRKLAAKKCSATAIPSVWLRYIGSVPSARSTTGSRTGRFSAFALAASSV